jgi:hypothetical protein
MTPKEWADEQFRKRSEEVTPLWKLLEARRQGRGVTASDEPRPLPPPTLVRPSWLVYVVKHIVQPLVKLFAGHATVRRR